MDRKENPFDQFDQEPANQFDQFEVTQSDNPFDQFDQLDKVAAPVARGPIKGPAQRTVVPPAAAPVAPVTAEDYLEPATSAPPPLSEAVRSQLDRKYDVLSPQDRDAIIRGRTKDGRQTLEGMYFAYRDKQFAARDADTAAFAKQLGPMAYRLSDLTDPRKESRARMAREQGASDKTAENIAAQAAIEGLPAEEVLPQAKESKFDFDLAARYKDLNPVVRGAVKGYYGYKQSVLGLNQALGDLVGATDFADTQRAGAETAGGRVESIGERPDYLSRNFEGAVSSVVQNIPGILGGIATGGALVPLSVLGVQSFGQNYTEGVSRGLTRDLAAQRAGVFAAFEILGERFGLSGLAKPVKDAIGKKDFDGFIDALSEYAIKQVPGELLTTTGQFLSDKYPSFALNPQAGLKEYLQQAGDTLTQTIMQGGLIMGAARGARFLAAGRRPVMPIEGRQPPIAGRPPEEPPMAPTEEPPIAPSGAPGGERIEPTVAAEPAITPERVEPAFGAEPTIEPAVEPKEPGVPGMVTTEMLAPKAVEQPEGQVAPAEPPVPSPIKPTVAPPQEPSNDTTVDGMLPVNVPLKDLTLSKDVPQFKMGADTKGVVEPLGGKFERTGVAPIQVWRRLDGSLEVISGRHRLDLARRSGEKTIPAQIHDEAQGFTLTMAAILDAELNIRDEQGKVKDYVNYFKASGITPQDAESRGLLARSTGKRAYTIATTGSDELVAAVRNDQVGDEAAYYIALNAPNDPRLQAVGLQAIQDGKSANLAVNMMQAIKALGVETDTTTDMFGFDDSAMKEAQAMAQIANRKQREIQTRLSAISGAAKNPALAKAEGIDIRDPEAVNRRIGELRQMKAAWDNWSTNPELIGQIRAERGVEAPSLALRGETEAEIRAREEDAAAEERRLRAEQEVVRRAEQEQAERARAEETVGLFELGQTPDQQLSGMGDLFAPPSQEPAVAKEKPAKVEAEPTYAIENLDGERLTYPEVVEWYRRAYKNMEDARTAYRRGELNDDQFLDAKQEFDAIKEEVDAIEQSRGKKPQAPKAEKPVSNIDQLQREYDKAKAAVDALGAEPLKPSPESRYFGSRGRAGASPEVVAKYDAQVKAHTDWKRKYFALKKAEVDASNALFRAIDALDSEGPLAFNVEPTEPGAAKPSRSRLGLYSALLEGINSVPTTSAPAASWKSVIKGLVNKGQVKADEVEWSGINDWLDLQQGKVSKEALQEYLTRGGVQVEETVLGPSLSIDEKVELTKLLKQWDALGGSMPGQKFERMQELSRRESDAESETKYGRYTLPGGENYREVLLTLPSREPKTYTYQVLGAFPSDEFATREEAQDYIDKFTKRLAKAEAEGQDFSYIRESIERSPFFIQEYESAESIKKSYRSPHFEQPNILASIRVNDRTDADGNKVLFVEELQSDWAQEGRKKGFAQDTTGWRVQQREDSEDPSEVEIIDRAGRVVWQGTSNGTDSQTIARAVKESTVPAAPFVTKTEGWLNLALKRIMVMAAEGGYDKVAFINGEQSADRYDLSKQIDRIIYDNVGGKAYIIALDNDERAVINETIPHEKLSDYVGKEIAEKIINGGESGLLEDVDLKVGGEGMKAFYGQIVPTAIKKLLPKVGGKKMETVDVVDPTQPFGKLYDVIAIGPGLQLLDPGESPVLETLRTLEDAKGAQIDYGGPKNSKIVERLAEPSTLDQPGFTVTDAMRKKVAEGVPMFSIEPTERPITVEFVTPSQQIREEQMSELQSLRQRLAAIPRKVAEERIGPFEPMLVKSMLERAKELKQLLAMSKERRDSPEQFLARALKEYDDGNISEDVLNVIKAAYDKYPNLLNGLLLSVRQRPESMGRASGAFAPIGRIVRLYKNTSGVDSPVTIRHELTHSMEQMMTPEQRSVIVDQWAKSLERAIGKHTDEKHQAYFKAVMDYMERPTDGNYRKAMDLLPSYDMYQYINPSEYWAVNAENLMAAQLGGHWQRFKAAMRRLFEGLKNVLGFDNKSTVHRVFAEIMGGEMKRLDYETIQGSSKVRTLNIEEDKALIEKYKRPKTPMLDKKPLATFLLDQFKNGKDLFRDFVESPKEAAADAGNSVIDGALRARMAAVWYGAGLESRDFAKYGGQLRTSEDLATASVALDNAIRSGNIGVEVIFRGGLKFDKDKLQLVAVETQKGMRGVYDAERRLKDKLGNQLGTDIIQAYLQAKRSISIMNEFYDRQAAYEGAKENLKMLREQGASEKKIKEAVALMESAERSLESVKKAVSSVTMTEEEMYEFAARDKAHPELREIMDNWTAVNQNLLRIWRDVGLLSQERYEALASIPDYAPWYRIMQDEEDPHTPLMSTTRGLTNIGREKLFKRTKPTDVLDFKGKEGKKVLDESGNLIGMSFKVPPSTVLRVEVDGERIKAKDLSVTDDGRVMVKAPIDDASLVVFKVTRPIQNIVDNMTQNVMRMTMNAIRQYAAGRIVAEYATRDPDGRIMTFPKEDLAKGRFSFVINGQRKVVEISDPLPLGAIYGMDSLNLKMFALPAAFANFFRRTITLSGVFQLKQVFKDAPTAAAVTGVRNPAALILGTYKGLVTALLQPVGKKVGIDIEPVVDILKAAGIGGFQNPSRTPEAEVKRRLGIMNRNVFDFVIKALDHIGDSSDMAQRIAVYKRVMAETGNETQALYQAANVINFLHHGSSGTAQTLVKTVPFMGAYANAMDVLVNSLIGGGLKGMSRRKAIARLSVTTGMLIGITLLYTMLVSGDDDYEELDDQTKLRNFIIPGTDIMLPMNTSYAFFWKAMTEMLYNEAIKKATPNEIDRTRLKKALSTAARDMLLGPEPVPQIIKGPVEIAIGYNFFTGRDIIPEGLKNVETFQQYTAATSELGKWFSSYTEVPGTDGKRILSPIEADHLIRSTFGTAGALGQWVTNRIAVEAGTRPELTEKETPITGAFLRPEVDRGREDLFYDLRDRVNQKYNTLRELERDDEKKAEAYDEKYEDLLDMHKDVNKIAADLSDINAEIRELSTSKDIKMTPAERRAEIRALQQEKKEILDDIYELRKEAGL